MSRATGATFTTPTALASVNSSADDWRPVQTRDGLTIFFGSRRTDRSGDADGDIWMAQTFDAHWHLRGGGERRPPEHRGHGLPRLAVRGRMGPAYASAGYTFTADPTSGLEAAVRSGAGPH